MDKYNGCFDDFLYFDLRVALVYFLPSEGHLSFGRLRIFGLRAGLQPYLGYFWPSERLNFFVLRVGLRPPLRTKKFSLSSGQKYPKYGLRPALRPKILNLPQDKCPSSGQKVKSHQNIHCTLSILQSQSIASAFDVSPYNLLKIYCLRNFSCASVLFSYFLKFIVKIY